MTNEQDEQAQETVDVYDFELPIKAVRNCLDMVRREEESGLDHFERVASMFEHDVGVLAPGKDVAPAEGAPTRQQRIELYDSWGYRVVKLALLGIDSLETLVRDLAGLKALKPEPGTVILCRDMATAQSIVKVMPDGWQRCALLVAPEGDIQTAIDEAFVTLQEKLSRAGPLLDAVETNGAAAGERAVTQLAGCLMAAEGSSEALGLSSEAYGWSPALAAVKLLRDQRDELQAEVERLRMTSGDPSQGIGSKAIFNDD